MSLAKTGGASPCALTFNQLDEVLTSKGTAELSPSIVDLYIPLFTTGQIPYMNRNSQGKAASKVNVGLGVEYQQYIDFIRSKLDLDTSKVSELVALFSTNLKGISPIPDSNELCMDFTETDILSYFLSKIMKQQAMYYTVSVGILKSDNRSLSKLKASIVDNGHTIIETLVHEIKIIKDLHDELLSSSTLSTLNDIDSLIVNNLTCLLIDLLNYFIYVLMKSQKGFMNTSVEKWFNLMQESDFLLSKGSVSSLETTSIIQSLSTLVTLLFLDLDFNTGSIDNESTFMSNPQSLINITNNLLNSPSNPVVLYAWSIILHRQYTLLEINSKNENTTALDYIKVLSNSPLKNLELTYLAFAQRAAELNVCEYLIDCNDLISTDSSFSSILGSFVIAFIPYIEPTYEIIKAVAQILRTSSNKIIKKFFENPFTDELLLLLKAKMPLTLNSFLELISINSNLAVEELRSLPTFMSQLDSSSFNPNYVIDDQQPELINLINDINVDLPFELNNELSLLIKKDTKAQIISNNSKTNKSLILFIYEYNGWSLLGRILKNVSTQIAVDDVERNQTCTVILKSLNDIFKDLNKNLIDLIFNSMNSFINENDIFDIIFRVFDQALLSKNIALLSNCASLFQTLSLKGYEYRIWSYLYKSDLFSFKSNGGLIIDILEKVEIASGSYEFVIKILKLGTLLVNSSLKFHPKINSNLKSKVIEYFQILSIQIFENFVTWKFLNEHEKFEIGNLIISFLLKIIQIEINFKEDASNNLIPTFSGCTKKIVDHFLIYDINDLRSVSPMLLTFKYLSDPKIEYTKLSKNGSCYSQWVENCFKFSIQLLKLRSIKNPKFPSTYEKELYLNLNNIIKSYLLQKEYRGLLLELLTKMVQSKWNDKPPSMLTHLNSTYSIILLNCISDSIANENVSLNLKISSFKFISSVLENNQKGLSLFLISGKIPTNENVSISLSNSSLYLLLKSLVSKIDNPSSEYTYHLLNSMAKCISIWLNVCADSEDIAFVEKLLEIIEGNEKDEKSLGFWNIEVTAKSVEILSLYLFVSRSKNKNCENRIFQLLNSSKFIKSLESKFRINQKNTSYMTDVENKMKNYFKDDIHINQFFKPYLQKIDYAVAENPYDFELFKSFFGEANMKECDIILGSLIKECDDARIIESQIDLAKSYGGLITCYCNVNPIGLSTEYCSLVASLLKANYEEGISLKIYDQVYKGRIELSFLIILTVSKSEKDIDDSTLFSIISSCQQLLESREVSFYPGLTSLKAEYYKPLLRILLITISMIKTATFVSEYSATLTDIFKDIICKSIYVLFSDIRNHALSSPNAQFKDSELISKEIDDILLILSFVQEFSKLKLTDDLEEETSNILITSGAYRSVAHMFAASHLIKMNNEEIFMDYSLSFVYEFSQKKKMAEKMIHDGIFHLLTESPVALILKKGHITPYSSNLIIVRLHRLWVKRILPIVLTMSIHFGDTIIFSLCKFALTFKRQFQYAIQAWLESESLISISIIEETEQLVLFAKVVSGLDCYNYVSAELGKNIEDVRLVPGLDTLQEKKVFVNALNYLLTHPKYLAMKVRTVDGNITIKALTEELKSLKDSLFA